MAAKDKDALIAELESYLPAVAPGSDHLGFVVLARRCCRSEPHLHAVPVSAVVLACALCMVVWPAVRTRSLRPGPGAP